jgi:hypothetical protein
MLRRTRLLLAPFLLLILSQSANADDAASGRLNLSQRTVKELRDAIAAIQRSGERPSDAAAAERHDALRRLKTYRYLAGVPYEDMELDEQLCKEARAGARLCERLGRLEHKPTNPGLPADEFELAYKGTSQGNLAEGYLTLARAIDGWMDDSDRGNIDRVGHRRWCLFPHLQKTGFGRSGRYAAMHVFDRSRTEAPDHDFIAFPPPGPMPVEYFAATAAWSVSLNPKKFALPSTDLKPVLVEVDRQGKQLGTPLPLNHTSVSNEPFGTPGCIIFRPERLQLRPGKRYRVEIDGLARADRQPAEKVSFVVEFASMR